MNSFPLLAVDKLTIDCGARTLVQDVSFSINHGEMVALVGGSGSGKTLTALSIMQLLDPPLFVRSGQIFYLGRNLFELSPGEMRKVRGQEISLVLQQALAAFNPTLTIGRQMEEAIREPGLSHQAKKTKVLSILTQVGIANPESRYHQYPFEFSGGMCQRALIGMALVGNPKLLIADEPTTALDATLQFQIMELLQDIQQTSGISILLITHDLSLAAGYVDRIVVMNHGKVVEQGPIGAILSNPADEYTKSLLAARGSFL